MENKVSAFFLSPKNQDRLIEIMEQLKEEGYPTDNAVMTMVLQEMRRQGTIPQGDNKEIVNILKKVVPKGGRILHVKGDRNERRG